MHSCPHCGERVEERDVYCFECGTYLGGEREQRRPETAQQHTPAHTDTPSTGEPERHERPRGRHPPGQSRSPAERHDTAHYPTDTAEATPTRITSLTTLWIALAAAIFATLENAGAILFADELAEQAAELGFGDEITSGAIAIQGALGLVVALGVAALCLYYYQQGYLDRRFYWGLILTGVLGFFVGAALSFFVFIIVGAYGLLVGLRRQKQQEQPPPDTFDYR